MSGLRKELEELINKHSIENGSNTPDFMLADYLKGCLDTFNQIICARDKWYSVHLEPCNSHFVEHKGDDR